MTKAPISVNPGQIIIHASNYTTRIKNNQWQYNLNTSLHVDTLKGSILDRGAVITANQWEFEKILGKEWQKWVVDEFSFTQDSNEKARYIPIAIEISPSCDYAQGHGRLYKYILGICRISNNKPSANIESNSKVPFGKKNRFYNLPTFYLNNNYYKAVLSYNYIVGVCESEMRNFELLFTLRDEITTLITSSSADYGSRIGCINVNES